MKFLLKKALLVAMTTTTFTTPIFVLSTGQQNYWQIIDDRSELVSKISQILNYKSHHPEEWYISQHQTLIFEQLNINAKEWYDETDPFIISMKQNLDFLESRVYAPSDLIYQQEFKNLTKSMYFHTLQDIENVINQNINYANNADGTKQKFQFNQLQFSDQLTPISLEIKNQVFADRLTALYNFLINSQLIHQNHIGQLFFNINHQHSNKSALGVTNLVSDGLLETQIGLYLNQSMWSDSNYLQDAYNQGLYASYDAFYTLIHEFGHVINNYYGLNLEQRNNLNKSHVIDLNTPIDVQIEKTIEMPDQDYQTINDVLQFAFNNMTEKIYGQKFNHNDLFILTELVAIPSLYGRMHDNEWFAEGFAYYFTTPVHRRTKLWDWWHEFFTQTLPNIQ